MTVLSALAVQIADDVASIECASLIYKAVFGGLWNSITTLTKREFEQRSADRLVSRYRVMRGFHSASIRESARSSILDELRRVETLFEATTEEIKK